VFKEINIQYKVKKRDIIGTKDLQKARLVETFLTLKRQSVAGFYGEIAQGNRQSFVNYSKTYYHFAFFRCKHKKEVLYLGHQIWKRFQIGTNNTFM